MSAAEAEKQAEQPQLGLWDAISIITGIVIGTSIFKIPWLIFLNVSDPWMGLLVWVFGGFLALAGGLCYAELGATYPRAGGDYVYLSRAYGSWVGFLFGWAQLVIVLTASIAAMAFVFAENAITLFNVQDGYEVYFALLAIVVITALNIVGVSAGKWTQNLLTIAKVVGLGAIIFAGLFVAKSNPAEWKFAEPSRVGWGGLAMILVLYAYGGWNDAAFVASEVRDVKRNIPLALILGIGAITLIYILVNAAYLIGLGFEDARAPGAQLPQKLLEGLMPNFGLKPEVGGKAITIIIMISALGAVNGLTFAGARVYATLGNDYPILGWLGHWKAGSKPPMLSLVAQALITASMIGVLCTETGHNAVNTVFNQVGIRHDSQWNPTGAFDVLVSHSAPVFWVFFLLTGMSLFLLREQDRTIQRPFSVPLYPFLPIIFCTMCIYMLYQSTIYVGFRALFAVVLVLLGLPIYFLSTLFAKPPVSQPPTTISDGSMTNAADDTISNGPADERIEPTS